MMSGGGMGQAGLSPLRWQQGMGSAVCGSPFPRGRCWDDFPPPSSLQQGAVAAPCLAPTTHRWREVCPVLSALPPDTPCHAPRQGWEHRASPGTAPQAQGTYPARCFLDLSEMPSRDMSLLNTMMPTNMFTLGESGAGVRARSPRRGRAGTHHAPGWGLGVPGSGSAHQHDDSSGSHEGVEQAALQ